MSQIDKRIKVNTIIENQLPIFNSLIFLMLRILKTILPIAEFRGPVDLITNFDQYLK